MDELRVYACWFRDLLADKSLMDREIREVAVVGLAVQGVACDPLAVHGDAVGAVQVLDDTVLLAAEDHCVVPAYVAGVDLNLVVERPREPGLRNSCLIQVGDQELGV